MDNDKMMIRGQVDGKAMHAGGSDIEADQKLRVFKVVPTKGE